MALPSITYTFTNGTSADATQVNQNFSDIIASLTDTTKSLAIDALDVSGAATLNAAVTLGNGTSDDITITGSLASTINIKTTNSFDIGSSTLGLQSIYLGSSGGAFTTRIKGAAVASSYTITTPLVVPVNDGDVLAGSTAAVTYWKTNGFAPGYTENLGLATATTSVAGDSIKITGASGTALSSTNPGWVCVSSATAGQLSVFKVTADVTINLTGAHWDVGTGGDLTDFPLIVYAINDAGTLKWGVGTIARRKLITSTLSSTTATSVTTGTMVLVNSALSGNSYCEEIGYFKADFDDTGGSSEDLWTVQTGSKDIQMGPSPIVWRKYVTMPTWQGFGTLTSSSYRYRFVNAQLELWGTIIYGTPTTTTGSVDIPFSLTFDANQCLSTASTTLFGMGNNLTNATIGTYVDGAGITFFYDGSDTNTMFIGNQIAARVFEKRTVDLWANAGDALEFKVCIPVVGDWF